MSCGVLACAVVIESGMAGVHRLQHVDRLRTTALANNDAIRPHAQRVAYEVADGDAGLGLRRLRPRLQIDDMDAVELQFRRVLDGNDTLADRDELRQAVQQRRLAGAGAARDDDVLARADRGLEEGAHRLAERVSGHQLADVEPRLAAEFADGEAGALDRQRRNDGVDT